MAWHNNRPSGIGSPRLDLSYTQENINNLKANFFGDTEPVNPSTGEIWIKDIGSSDFEQYVYDGSSWIKLQRIRSPLSLPGGLSFKTREASATTTLLSTDDVTFFDATSGAITVGLPDASTNKGQIFFIFKTDVSANFVTLSSDDLISGVTTKDLSNQFNCVKVISDGTTYYEIT